LEGEASNASQRAIKVPLPVDKFGIAVNSSKVLDIGKHAQHDSTFRRAARRFQSDFLPTSRFKD